MAERIQDLTPIEGLERMRILVNELKAAFNAHTHRADGAQPGAYNVSRPTGLPETPAVAAGVNERIVVTPDVA
ncbi:MAG: hypothetical protein DDT31_01211 [Syntrophomonadaceae bacterium]|nr:hypothetical protein [Bacillota bacterium]